MNVISKSNVLASGVELRVRIQSLLRLRNLQIKESALKPKDIARASSRSPRVLRPRLSGKSSSNWGVLWDKASIFSHLCAFCTFVRRDPCL